MKQVHLYNELARCYNRSRKKLQRLAQEGKNLRKQNILQKRIARLFKTLMGLQRALKLGMATAALSAGMVLFQSHAVMSQITFGPAQANPFGLSYGYDPSFADLDADGDMDLIAFSAAGSFEYFQNTGTAATPAYAAAQINPFGLVSYYFSIGLMDVADLDGDGDIDLMAGDYGGDFLYFQNSGTAAVPAFAAPIFNPYGLLPTGNALSPTFADLDGDGDLDLLTGETYGWLRYFQNTGTYTTPAFASPIKEPFGLGHFPAYWTNPEFVDLDGDGDFDLMYSFHPNSLRYCENAGTKFVPDFLPFVDNPFGLPGGGNTAFADLDGDGDLDMLADGFVYYENTTATSSCLLPPGAIALDITSTSTKLQWENVTDSKHYKVRYKEAGATDWIIIPKIKTNSKVITGLSPGTQYYWQLKNVCSVNPRITSEWSVKQFFTTTTLRLGDERTTAIEIYPNPTSEKFILHLRLNSTANQPATIYLLNTLGQVVYSSVESVGNGELIKTITMPSTSAAGWYVAKVVMSDQVMEQKLLYQK